MSPKYTIQQGPRGRKQLGRGLCPHCKHRVRFEPPPGGSPSWSYIEHLEDEPPTTVEHTFVIGLCPDPECRKATIVYEVGESMDGVLDSWTLIKHQVVYPAESGRMLLEEEVPLGLRELYAEAGRIEALSPNGAAFLGRRMLEQVLKEQLGVKTKRNARLADLIDRYLEATTLPGELYQLMHDVRSFGNIAGHPSESDKGEILDVEPQEASYVLDVVGELLDYVYVRPRRQEEMRSRYKAKNDGKTPGSPRLGSGITVINAQPSADLLPDSDEDLPF